MKVELVRPPVRPDAVVAVARTDKSEEEGHEFVAVCRASSISVLRYDANRFTHVYNLQAPIGASLTCVGWCTSPTSTDDTIFSGLRLFAGSATGHLIEYHLHDLTMDYLECHSGPIHALSVSPTRDVLAIGCDNGHVKMFTLNAADDSPILEPVIYPTSPHKGGAATCLAWSPDGSFLVSGGGSTVITHPLDRHVAHGAMQWPAIDLGKSKPRIRPTAVAVTDDECVMVGSDSGEISFWELPVANRLFHATVKHPVTALAMGTHSRRPVLFIGSEDGRVALYEYLERRGEWHPAGTHGPHTHAVTALALDGEGVVISGSTDSRLAVLDVDRFKQGGGFRRVSPMAMDRARYHINTVGRTVGAVVSTGTDAPAEARVYSLPETAEGDASLLLTIKGNARDPATDRYSGIAVSDSGTLVALTTPAGVRLFRRSDSPDSTPWERVGQTLASNLHGAARKCVLPFPVTSTEFHGDDLVCGTASGAVVIVGGDGSVIDTRQVAPCPVIRLTPWARGVVAVTLDCGVVMVDLSDTDGRDDRITLPAPPACVAVDEDGLTLYSQTPDGALSARAVGRRVAASTVPPGRLTDKLCSLADLQVAPVSGKLLGAASDHLVSVALDEGMLDVDVCAVEKSADHVAAAAVSEVDGAEGMIAVVASWGRMAAAMPPTLYVKRFGE